MFPKQGPKMEGVVLHREGLSGLSFTGSEFQSLSGIPKPKHGASAPRDFTRLYYHDFNK